MVLAIESIPKSLSERRLHRVEIDLMSWKPDAIVSFLDERVASGENLLHGTGRNSFYLKPMPGFDVYRESGRQTAIYATNAPGQALKQAVYNARLARTVAALTNTIEVSRMGCPINNTGRVETNFAFMPQIYAAISNDSKQPTDLLRDGFVFELPKRFFEPDPEVSPGYLSTDYFSRQAIIPSRVYLIPRTVGHLLFGNINRRFNTQPYSDEQVAEMTEILQKLHPSVHR